MIVEKVGDRDKAVYMDFQKSASGFWLSPGVGDMGHADAKKVTGKPDELYKVNMSKSEGNSKAQCSDTILISSWTEIRSLQINP